MVGDGERAADANRPIETARVPEAARQIGQELKIVYASSPTEIDDALSSLATRKPDGLLVASDPIFSGDGGKFIKFRHQPADGEIPRGRSPAVLLARADE